MWIKIHFHTTKTLQTLHMHTTHTYMYAQLYKIKAWHKKTEIWCNIIEYSITLEEVFRRRLLKMHTTSKAELNVTKYYFFKYKDTINKTIRYHFVDSSLDIITSDIRSPLFSFHIIWQTVCHLICPNHQVNW